MLSGLSNLSQLFWGLEELCMVNSPEIHLKRKFGSMGRPSHAREKLRQVASDLIWENTYVSVSVNQICLRANVHKGSFYYFFRTKADLAIAACEMHWQEAQPELEHIFSSQVPPLGRLTRWCNYIQRTQKEKAQKYGHVCGCADTSVGAELLAPDANMRIKVEELIERTTKFIESAITDAIREGSIARNDPKASARQVCSYVLGLLLQARIRNDLNVLRDLQATVITLMGVKGQAPSDFTLSAHDQECNPQTNLRKN
jgi:TetR/AcrR family transcriptional repressor of nem operon